MLTRMLFYQVAYILNWELWMHWTDNVIQNTFYLLSFTNLPRIRSGFWTEWCINLMSFYLFIHLKAHLHPSDARMIPPSPSAMLSQLPDSISTWLDMMEESTSAALLCTATLHAHNNQLNIHTFFPSTATQSQTTAITINTLLYPETPPPISLPSRPLTHHANVAGSHFAGPTTSLFSSRGYDWIRY